MCKAKAPEFRISYRLLFETLLVASALSFFLFLPPLWAQSPDLPPAPVRAKVATACLECHESRIILQQRLSRAAWTKEVDKMIKWGAVVDAADRDAFIDYLSTNFPPDKPPEPAVRSSSSPKEQIAGRERDNLREPRMELCDPARRTVSAPAQQCSSRLLSCADETRHLRSGGQRKR